MPINNLTVNLGAFKSSQIAVLSSITGNVSSISLSRGPGAPTNGGKCYLTVGGNINGAVNADAYNLYVTGSISGNVQCAGALTGAIQAGGNISGNITINGTSNSTGSIIATGNITGTVTIPNFTGTGNICAANLNVDNIFCMQPNILPTGANGVFSGTWTVCGDPPSGMPCPGTSPSPAHDATGVMITKRLSWTAGANTTAYKVYLGTDTSQMALIGSGPAANCVPPLLEPNTSYYWRVDAVNANGTVTGTVWQFTTAAAPTILYVDDDSTASPPDGQSWATAYPNLQDALTAVGTNTNYSLWVAAGTYTPGTLATSTFTMKNGVAILGGFAGDEDPAHRTRRNTYIIFCGIFGLLLLTRVLGRVIL